MEFHDRLRKARIDAGFPSAAEAARRLGVPYGTYSGHENGQRGAKWDEVRKYSKAFKVKSGWLMFGEPAGGEDGQDNYDASILSFSGIVREGGRVEVIDPDEGVILVDESGNEISADYGFHKYYLKPERVENFYVASNEFGPIVRYGDAILVSESIASKKIEMFLFNQAVCYTEEAGVWFRELQPSSRAGHFNLYMAGQLPIVDCKVNSIKIFEAVVKSHTMGVNLGVKFGRPVQRLRASPTQGG